MKKITRNLAVLFGLGAVLSASADDLSWQSMATGSFQTYGIKSDGTLWSWGSAEQGELGNGSKTPAKVSAPGQIGEATDWKSATGGNGRGFFIKQDGSIWSTGTFQSGVLGTGATANQLTPVQIGTDKDWASVCTSIQSDNYDALAIKTDGSLWGWGRNEYGCLGVGDYNSRPTPAQIGADKDWVEVSMGRTHALALKKDGSIWGTGNGKEGALGADNNANTKVWVKVADADPIGWTAVYAIENSSYAIKADGSLWAWGNNTSDILGLNLNDAETSVEYVSVPTKVTAITEPVHKVAGSQRLRAVTVGNGSATKVYTWGYNFSGQLGNATGVDFGDYTNVTIYDTPQLVTLPETVSGISDISSGEDFIVLLSTDGKLYGWGSNAWGQLGTSEPENLLINYKTTPIEVAAIPQQVEPGAEFDAANIPSSLAGVEKITLTGEWGTEDFAKLIGAIGNGQGLTGFLYNEALKTVDMAQVTFKENTSLEKVFRNCSVLETVIMPTNESAANLVSLNNAFLNDRKLSFIDISNLINVADLTQAFQNCVAISSLDLSKWTGVTASEMAFPNCNSLASIVLPGKFKLDDRCFSGCEALKFIDWSKYEGTTAPDVVITSNYEPFYGIDFVPSEKKKITIMVSADSYESFCAHSYWQGFNIVQAEAPGTYTVPANEIPASLSDATKVILTGLWDTDKFKALATALGTASGITASNSTLVAIDMHKAEIAEATKLTMQVPGALFGTSPKGVFQKFTALETVVMPEADQAANFTSFEQAFQDCQALKGIDLSGCTGVTKNNSAFYGCTSLEKVTLPKSFPLNTEVFDRCTAMKTLDWSLYDGTTAPSYSSSAMPSLDNSKDLTVIVPAAAYDAFIADAKWNKFTIIKATSGITDVIATDSIDTVRPVYNLSGCRVATLAPGEDATSLPAGLYIIAGKKVLVR